MLKTFLQKVLFAIIIGILILSNCCNTCYAMGKQQLSNENTIRTSSDNPHVTIVLDPGHGGSEDGAYYYGEKEKYLNLKIATLVKEGLEKYENVDVSLTRTDDVDMSLKDRAAVGFNVGADILISIHCNASVSHVSHGSSVYISTGEAERKKLRDFADLFLGEFEAIGLDNAGTFARVTQMGRRHADGSFDDYYGVLRHSYNYGVPALLVEHCFVDSEIDRKFIDSNEGIEKLANADINAIVAYYGLIADDGTVYEGKHATRYGATTKAVEYNYYAPPKLNDIELVEYKGTTPGMATYKVEIEDGIGVNSIYLVYKNGTGGSFTIPLIMGEELKTGEYCLKGYVPENLDLRTYSLSYVGMYDKAGFDGGYNVSGGKLTGFGKCDWLNSFYYNGKADLAVREKVAVSVGRIDYIDEKIRLGLRSPWRVYKEDFIIK